MMSKIFGSIGVNFRTADAAVRDSAARVAVRGVAQRVVLVTCNRTEVFYYGDAADADTIRQAFARVGVSAALEARCGADALSYLFRVAAGLESMVLGEYQILGQVRDAYRAAVAQSRVGTELDLIFRQAISCAKEVKTTLDLGACPPSVCRAGMDAVNAVCPIAGKSVFVIGSGKTGTLAAKIARSLGADTLTVCNRSPERTRKLVAGCGARAVDYTRRFEQIQRSDIVVSATASPHLVVPAAEVRLVRPVVFLDLASPRDVDPALAGNPLARLVSIDTIGALAEGDRRERAQLFARGIEIVRRWTAETEQRS